MKDSMNWSDLSDFVRIAEFGGLAEAARQSGQSQATLSRHMTRLEADLGKRLFQRGKGGYTLTPEGRELLKLGRDMQRGAEAIDAWRAAQAAPPLVRISAGFWTSAFLARQMQLLLQEPAAWRPDFVTSQARLDISRREVDIGIRNTRPTEPWLSGQRIGGVAFCIYAAHPEVSGWIALTGPAAKTPSAQWTARQNGPVTAQANTPWTLVQLARSGLGRVVLPKFTEDLSLGLTRISGPIPELASERWLVSHHEGRHDKPTRAALTQIARLFKSLPREKTDNQGGNA